MKDLLGTIEAIHGAGLDADLWPQALAAVGRIVGGRIATIEAFDKQTLRHREFLAHGMPPVGQLEYLDHYAALNLRLPLHVRARPGDILYDYLILDESAMKRAPFYAEFLPRIDCRYFVSGIIASSQHEFAAVTVQRSPRHGHIERAGIATMARLLPHVAQAFDVARRIKSAGETRRSLEQALDWLADGVALVRADGHVAYANELFQAMARQGDALRLRKGAIAFAAAEAGEKFDAAIGAAARLKRGEVDAVAADFIAARRSGGPPCLVSVRPLLDSAPRGAERRAVAAVFVRDPLRRHAAAIRTLREIFGLTDAEAHLAQALQAGVTLAEYAGSRGLSPNTVYTHLRRLREKTGCTRMPELIHKLNDLRLPLRLD
jgi:DNA-binding CsgD family transcriptional regulator/PAS domain-containing protein